MPVHWGGRAWLAGHMKYRVLLARPLFPRNLPSSHHISRPVCLVSSLSALVMSCRLQVINPVCLSPPVVASTPPAPFLPSCPTCPALGLWSCSPTARETFSWTVMAPNLVFDIALTLLLVEEAKEGGKRLCSQEFLVFLVVVCCLLFLTWYFSIYFSRKAGRLERLEHSGHSPTGPVAV